MKQTSYKRIEIWLCHDCMEFVETGDSVGLYYQLSEKEAKMREKEIMISVDRLTKRGDLLSDWSDPSEEQWECSDCRHIADKEEFEFRLESEDEDEARICPKCKSDDTSAREHGVNDFSWRECDCCGTRLGGERTRYALFLRRRS